MKRNTVLKVLNPVLAVLLANQLLTGFFAAGLPHELFEVLHEGGAVLLAVAGVLHAILNWNWVKTSYFGRASTAKT
jgi:hypothetical protein